MSLTASIFSLLWNTMEWNWIGDGYDCYDQCLMRLKILPLYALSILYKSACMSITVAYLRLYSLPTIGCLAAGLATANLLIRRNYEKTNTDSATGQYKCKCICR